MSDGIWEKWNLFRASVDDTTSTIRSLFEVVGVGAVIIVLIGKWLEDLNSTQRNALWVVGACIAVVVFTYFLDWQRKRSTDKIPELLAKMDTLIFDYIDYGEPVKNAPEALVDDLSKLMNVNISELKAAAKSNNKNRAEQEFAKFTDAHSKRFNSKSFSDNILNLRLAGAIMTEYKVGLIAITSTKEYQALLYQMKYLRRRLPSVLVSRSINEYLNQSDGLYNLLFSIQPFAELGTIKEIIPVRIRAYSDVIRPIVESHTATLINAVRENIENYKHGKIGDDNTSKKQGKGSK